MKGGIGEGASSVNPDMTATQGGSNTAGHCCCAHDLGRASPNALHLRDDIAMLTAVSILCLLGCGGYGPAVPLELRSRCIIAAVPLPVDPLASYVAWQSCGSSRVCGPHLLHLQLPWAHHTRHILGWTATHACRSSFLCCNRCCSCQGCRDTAAAP